MGYFLSLSKPATTRGLEISEWALLLFGILLVIGIVGEIRSGEWSVRLHMFELLVLWGVCGELLADGGIFLFSTHLEAISDEEVGLAMERASNAERETARLNVELA